MKRKITIPIVLFMLLKVSFSGLLAQSAPSCSVLFNFDNTPLPEVLDEWAKWCSIKITYDAETIKTIKVTGKYDLIPIGKALDLALAKTPHAWKARSGQMIEIMGQNDAIEFIKITNSFDNTPLDRIINIWKFNYKLDIIYNPEDIAGIKIFGKLKDEPLDIAFEKILASTQLSFKIEGDKKVTLFIPEEKKLNLEILGAVTYNVTVSGIIKDEESGESLPFANVFVKGTTIATTTNLDGHFTIPNVPSDTSILTLSYIGYLTKDVRLTPGLNIKNLELTINSGANQLQEVTVTAQKKEQILKQTGISKLAMTPEIASILPSTGEKDIFRSLQLLPGISGSNESSSGLYVRGGTPDQNLIILDGFTVYHVDHLYGFFSAFNSNAIKDVQLYKGGFESKFGGRLSSVVDITAKDGNSENLNAGINLSFLSVNAFVESPFDHGKGSFIITGRRSYQSFLYKKLFESFTLIIQESLTTILLEEDNLAAIPTFHFPTTMWI